MYLLHCKNCGDTYSLKTTKEVQCSCGITNGIVEDEKVIYSGDPMIIQIDDQDLSQAIFNQQIHPTSQSIGAKLLHVTDEKLTRRS